MRNRDEPKALPADAKDPITMGEVAYNAYRKASGRKSLVSGAPIPLWRYLPDDIRAAWNAAGAAVAALAGEPGPRNIHRPPGQPE